MTMNRKLAAGIASGLAVAAALPGSAGGHATVSALQPQGSVLTGARTTFALRAPNETADKATYRVRLYVPEAVQEAISVAQTPGWKVSLTRERTGETDDEGAPVMKTTRVNWTAKRGEEVVPGMFGQWLIRFQSPARTGKLCFKIHQFYAKVDSRGRRTAREVHHWDGPEGADRPQSCVTVVDG